MTSHTSPSQQGIPAAAMLARWWQRGLAVAGRPGLRDHLAATLLAAVLFLVLFHKAVFGPYTFGSLPKHQQIGISWQVPWLAQEDLPITERQPRVLDPDYHLLFELDSLAAARDIRAGHLPYFDFTRMLGVPLWGSLIFDFANPLNCLLAFCTVPQVHLIKVLLSLVIASNGFVVLMRELGARTMSAWVIATAVYLGNNYTVYYVYWIGMYTNICLAPLILGLILRFLRTGSPAVFLGLCLTAAYAIAVNFCQINIQFGIFCVGAVMTTVILEKLRSQFMLRTALLGFAAVCAAVACFEQLAAIGLTAADSSRIAAQLDDAEFIYPTLQTPSVPVAYSTFFFGNITHTGEYPTDIFVSWAAVLGICAGLMSKDSVRREVRVIRWLFAVFCMFFFVGWLDAPLYLLGKLYAPNICVSRGQLNLFLPAAALAGTGIEGILQTGPTKIIRRLAVLGLFIVAVLGLAAASGGPAFVLRCLFARSGLLYESYIRSLAFWLVLAGGATWLLSLACADRFSKARSHLLACAGAIAVCIGIGNGRIPFYLASDASNISAGNTPDVNSTRVVRFVPNYQIYAYGPPGVERRFVNDATFSTMGMKALTGFHTSMSKPELKVFDTMLTDAFKKSRETERWARGYSLGRYDVFLDGPAIAKESALRPDKVLELQLLGVRYVIDGAALSQANPQPPYSYENLPKLDLGTRTLSHFLEDASEKDVRSVFSETCSDETVNALQSARRRLVLESTGDGRVLKARLGRRRGTVIVPYHFGHRFLVTVDGVPVPEKDGLGLCIFETTDRSEILEIRALDDGIIARLVGGVCCAAALAFGGCLICKRFSGQDLCGSSE